MTIRYARPEPGEAEALAALHVACWREAYAGLVPQAILDAASPATRLGLWQAVLSEPDRIAVAAYDVNVPVGFVMAGKALERLFDGMDGHIPALYVRASHYRMGIGRQLMGRAAAAWRVRNGRSLALGVLAGNARARAFYEALGGRLVRTGTYHWDGHALEDAIYVFERLEELELAAPPVA